MKKSKYISLVLISAALASCDKQLRETRGDGEIADGEPKKVYMRSDTTEDYMPAYTYYDDMLWYYSFSPSYGIYWGGYGGYYCPNYWHRWGAFYPGYYPNRGGGGYYNGGLGGSYDNGGGHYYGPRTTTTGGFGGRSSGGHSGIS
jgi:hypothetical protein